MRLGHLCALAVALVLPASAKATDDRVAPPPGSVITITLHKVKPHAHHRHAGRAAHRVRHARAKAQHHVVASRESVAGRELGHGRPYAWCGWYMSISTFGKNIRDLWVARNWARVGSPAPGPAPGVIVVWAHHVGKIVGPAGQGRWLVHSGNDGHAVRTRARSVAGAIAFRRV